MERVVQERGWEKEKRGKGVGYEGMVERRRDLRGRRRQSQGTS